MRELKNLSVLVPKFKKRKNLEQKRFSCHSTFQEVQQSLKNDQRNS